MIHQLQKLVILSSPKPVAYWRIIPRTGKSPHVQATGKVNRDRLVAYWRIIPRTGKLSHVQATKQKDVEMMSISCQVNVTTLIN